MGKTYTRVGNSKGGGSVGKSGATRSLNHGASSVKGRLSAGTAVHSKVNTGRGGAKQSSIPSATSRYAGSGGVPAQAGSTFRSHGHAPLAAKTRSTANRKGQTKLLRAGGKVPGPI